MAIVVWRSWTCLVVLCLVLCSCFGCGRVFTFITSCSMKTSFFHLPFMLCMWSYDHDHIVHAFVRSAAIEVLGGFSNRCFNCCQWRWRVLRPTCVNSVLYDILFPLPWCPVFSFPFTTRAHSILCSLQEVVGPRNWLSKQWCASDSMGRACRRRQPWFNFENHGALETFCDSTWL